MNPKWGGGFGLKQSHVNKWALVEQRMAFLERQSHLRDNAGLRQEATDCEFWLKLLTLLSFSLALLLPLI